MSSLLREIQAWVLLVAGEYHKSKGTTAPAAGGPGLPPRQLRNRQERGSDRHEPGGRRTVARPVDGSSPRVEIAGNLTTAPNSSPAAETAGQAAGEHKDEGRERGDPKPGRTTGRRATTPADLISAGSA